MALQYESDIEVDYEVIKKEVSYGKPTRNGIAADENNLRQHLYRL